MKKLIIALFVLSGITTLRAQQWLDVTDRYVVNPKYENDSKSGWNWYANSSSTETRSGCQEFWNGTFNMYQTIEGLPNGKYRIEVQAFYRNGDASYTQYTNYLNGNTGVTAYLYGNDQETAVASIYTPTTGTGFPQTLTLYNNNYTSSYTIPNTMESAASYFSVGNFQNQLEVEVTDQTLKMGISTRDATAEKDKSILESTMGQLSDGIWENSRGS